MPLLFSPLSEGILEGPFKPFPKSAFIMLHSGKNVSEAELKIDAVLGKCLARLKHPIQKAARHSGTKDYLEKIIQIIRGCGFGVAIFSELTPAATLANIFFEIGLCSVFGKPVILIKTAEAKPPSDFVRTEWITYQPDNAARLRKDLEESIKSVVELAEYYEALGDLAMEAEHIDVELAFERYKQAILIADKPEVRRKIKKLWSGMSKEYDSSFQLGASKTRFRTSILEFVKLLPP